MHVPDKGVPEALNDTVDGRVQFTMAPLGSSIGLVREGRLRALSEPETQQRLTGLGMEAAPTTPEQLDKFVGGQLAMIAQLAKKAGVQAR